MIQVKKKVLIISLSVFWAVIFFACTSNPLSDDEISPGKSQITGRVEVGDNLKPEGVYVWLEGFDVGTFTNQNGEFKITLPSTAQNSGGATGAFNIYYYLANYQLERTKVTVQRGEFVFSGEINKNGELLRPKFIPRILDVSTVLTPPTAIADSSIFMKVEVILSSEADSVKVFYPLEPFDGPNKLIAPLFVKNLETNAAFYFEPTLAGVNNDDEITIMRGRPYVRTMLVILSKGTLSEGQYEIVPYLKIIQPEVPAELLNNLIEDIDAFGLDYLNVPFLRTNGVLSVVKGVPGEGGN